MLDLSYIVQDMTNTNTDNKTEERKNRFTGESIKLTKEESIEVPSQFQNPKSF
jgi:hypothetical protein